MSDPDKVNLLVDYYLDLCLVAPNPHLSVVCPSVSRSHDSASETVIMHSLVDKDSRTLLARLPQARYGDAALGQK